MKIGEVIRKYRREKGLTQEAMAIRLGVSTPAVNKWENGASLPDVTMLAPIARLLGVTVDTLLSFRQELTDEEVNDLVRQLWPKLSAEPFGDVLEWVRGLTEEYPNCGALQLYMAQGLEAFCTVMNPEREAGYEEFILTCYERALESENEQVVTAAADALFHYCLRKQDHARAEGYLAYFSAENPERKRKQALLYEKTGRTEEACRTYEELLYTGCQTMRLVFQSLYSIAAEQGDIVWAKILAEKHGEMVRVFDLGRYNELAPLLDVAVLEQDGDSAVSCLAQLLDSVDTLTDFVHSPLYMHMQFRENETDMEEVRRTLKHSFRDGEGFRFLHEHPRWAEIME